MDALYGITTTTLVVLSSFTLAIFQVLLDAVIKKEKYHHSLLSKYTDFDNNFKYDCEVSIKYILSERYEKLQNLYTELKNISRIEFYLLLIVVFLSALSILFVLLHGIFQFEWITIKLIFSFNIVAMIIYIYSFISFIIRLMDRKKQINIYAQKVIDFLNNIKTADNIN